MGYLDMGETPGHNAEKCYIKARGWTARSQTLPGGGPGAQGWPVPLKLAAPGHVVPRPPLVVPH